VALTRYFGKEDLSGVHVAIVGDIAHSRVARSNIIGLTKLGATVTLVGPQELVPDDLDCETSVDFDAVLQDVSACMMLRVQFERDAEVGEDYREKFGLTEARAKNYSGAILHPGPMNRGIEIDDSVANIESSPHNLILSQVTCGVATRMAILEHLIG
jgi:aspartate carbamoyltransferase catalytic subunit